MSDLYNIETDLTVVLGTPESLTLPTFSGLARARARPAAPARRRAVEHTYRSGSGPGRTPIGGAGVGLFARCAGAAIAPKSPFLGPHCSAARPASNAALAGRSAPS